VPLGGSVLMTFTRKFKSVAISKSPTFYYQRAIAHERLPEIGGAFNLTLGSLVSQLHRTAGKEISDSLAYITEADEALARGLRGHWPI